MVILRCSIWDVELPLEICSIQTVEAKPIEKDEARGFPGCVTTARRAKPLVGSPAFRKTDQPSVDRGRIVANGPIRLDKLAVQVAENCSRRSNGKKQSCRACEWLNVPLMLGLGPTLPKERDVLALATRPP